MAANNKGFGVSRGVVSCDALQEFGSPPPVQAFVKPRPPSSPKNVLPIKAKLSGFEIWRA